MVAEYKKCLGISPEVLASPSRTIVNFWKEDLYYTAIAIRRIYIPNWEPIDEDTFLKACLWLGESDENLKMLEGRKFLRKGGLQDIPINVALNANTLNFMNSESDFGYTGNTVLEPFVAISPGHPDFARDIENVTATYFQKLQQFGEASIDVGEYSLLQAVDSKQVDPDIFVAIRAYEKVDATTYLLLQKYYMTLLNRKRRALNSIFPLTYNYQ